MRALLLTLALLLGPVCPTYATPGTDHRPCVSRAEWRAPHVGHRHAVEALWEVEGLGYVDDEYSLKNWALWIYPACGYPPGKGEIWLYFNRDHGQQGYGIRYTEGVPNGNV